MSCSSELGKLGEELACRELAKQGCRILHSRWRYRHLELDIVATDGQNLIIAEVKTRSSLQWGDPLQSIDYKKIKHIVHATDVYIKKHHIDLPYRFDIFSIIIDDNGNSEIEHIKDAFYPPLG